MLCHRDIMVLVTTSCLVFADRTKTVSAELQWAARQARQVLKVFREYYSPALFSEQFSDKQ